MHVVDIASYQGDLDPVLVATAGIGIVNLKISHGLGQKSVHPELARWARLARELGIGVCTFHYMTADAPGIEQAEHAYRQMTQHGLLAGTAHQLDVESNPAPALADVRAYLERMTQLLGRPVALYTGDWYWKPRGWNVSDLTPYLWSAPNAGYLGRYPGDDSAHWQAGYGGWPNLAIMQYAVSPIGSTTIKVSKSAIRDPAAWRALTLGRPGMSYAPDSIMAARRLVMDTLRAAGQNVNPASYGVIGDDDHAKSGSGYHLGKDALKDNAYSIVESARDRKGLTNAVAGFDWGDFTVAVAGKRHDLQSMSLWMVAQCKAGAADTLDLREIIYSPDGRTVKRWDRLGIRTTGDSSHTTHTHFSWFRDSEKRDKTALFRRYFTEIGLLAAPAMEDDMPLTPDDADLVIDRLLTRQIKTTAPDGTVTNYGSINGAFATQLARSGELRSATLPALGNAVAAILKNVTDDDVVAARARADLLAAIEAAGEETADAVLARLGGSEQSDAEIAAALRAALGPRSAAVGAILKG